MLCKICEAALSHFKVRAQFCPHQSSVELLAKSAEDGCFLCAALWFHCFGTFSRDGDLSTSSVYSSAVLYESQSGSETSFPRLLSRTTSDSLRMLSEPSKEAIPFRQGYSAFRQMTFSRLRVMTDDRGFACIALWIAGAELWESLFTFVPADLMLSMLDDSGASLFEDMTRPHAVKVSRSDISLVQEWLDNCVDSHISCRSSSEKPSWNPTRLVYCGAESVVKLIETAAASEPAIEYATLSHRWKSSSPLRNTHATKLSLENGVLVSILPKTYQDAVHVTRALGVNYIWIDSLCIIQDDEVDWLAEAPQMDRVYENSVINISATGAQTSDEGLFFEQQEQLATACAPEFWHLKEYGTCILMNDKLWSIEVDQAPLSARAWVLQERLLAPRVVHFGRRQVFWECNTCVQSQQFRKGIPRGLSLDTDRTDLRRDQLYLLSESREQRLTAWLTIVERYSSCDLTFPEDKLLALAGLARSFTRTFQSAYIAGLWKSEMCHHLLWQSSGLSKVASRPGTFRAPSWSWASIDGSVAYPPDFQASLVDHTSAFKQLLVIVDARSENVADDPFAPCLFARLIVLGRLLTARPNQVSYFSPVKFNIGLDTPWQAEIERAWAFPDLPVDPDELKQEYLFTPILFRIRDKTEVRLLGLLLEPAVPRQPVYRRVGFVDVVVRTSGPAESFVQSLQVDKMSATFNII